MSLPPLDPKALQNERFQEDFGTEVKRKEKGKKQPVKDKVNKLFQDKTTKK